MKESKRKTTDETPDSQCKKGNREIMLEIITILQAMLTKSDLKVSSCLEPVSRRPLKPGQYHGGFGEHRGLGQKPGIRGHTLAGRYEA